MKFGDKGKTATGRTIFYMGDYDSLESFTSTMNKGLDEKETYTHSNPRIKTMVMSHIRKLINNDYIKSERELPKNIEEFHRFRADQKVSLAMQSTPGYDVVGDVVDFGRFLVGEPEFMINYARFQETTKRMIDLKLRLCCPLWLSAKKYRYFSKEGTFSDGMKKLFAYYLPILDMIDNWEQSGIRCRITVEAINGDSGRGGENCQRAEGSFVIKDYDRDFDLETFVRVFMTEQVGTLISSFSCASQAWTGKHSNRWLSFDYWKPETECTFNSQYPDMVVIPSVWHAYRNDFKPQTGEELLIEKGYPVSTYQSIF